MAGRGGPQEEAKIPVNSFLTLQNEIDRFTIDLAPDEREDTWMKLEKALVRFAAITRGGGYKMTELYVKTVGAGPLGDKIVSCMLSERGRLAGAATDFLNTMAPRLGTNFSHLILHYLPPLIRLFGRASKVSVRRAEKSLTTIITNCHIPIMIPMLRQALGDKAESTRVKSGGALEKIMTDWEKQVIGSKGVVELEMAMRKMATEKDQEVRKMGKRMWEMYVQKWPERVDDFTAPLTPTIRKYLDINTDKAAGSRNPSNLMQSTAVKRTQPSTTIHPTTVPSISAAVSTVSNGRTTALRVLSAQTQATRSAPILQRGEEISFAPLERPDPFAPVHPKSTLTRSTSGVIAGPSNFPYRPAQLRSVSASIPQNLDEIPIPPPNPIASAETYGPVRTNFARSLTMPDIQGIAKRHNGPIRPQRPAPVMEGIEPTTPAPSRLGAPVRPARDPLMTSQNGRMAMESVKKEVGMDPAVRRPPIPAFDIMAVRSRSDDLVRTTTVDEMTPMVANGESTIRAEQEEVQEEVAYDPPSDLGEVQASAEEIQDNSGETKAETPLPPTDAAQNPLDDNTISPAEEEISSAELPQTSVPLQLEALANRPKPSEETAAQVQVESDVSIAPSQATELPHSSASMPPSSAPPVNLVDTGNVVEAVQTPIEVVVPLVAVVPALAELTVAQAEALLAAAKAREKVGSTSQSADIGPAQTLSTEKPKAIGATKTAGRAPPISTATGRTATLGDKAPPGTRREAFKPTASASTVKMGVRLPPKLTAGETKPVALPTRKPEIPAQARTQRVSGPTGVTTKATVKPPQIATSSLAAKQSSLTASTSSSASKAGPPIAPTTTKVPGQVQPIWNTARAAPPKAKPVSPRKPKVKMKAALPPPPPKGRAPSAKGLGSIAAPLPKGPASMSAKAKIAAHKVTSMAAKVALPLSPVREVAADPSHLASVIVKQSSPSLPASPTLEHPRTAAPEEVQAAEIPLPDSPTSADGGNGISILPFPTQSIIHSGNSDVVGKAVSEQAPRPCSAASFAPSQASAASTLPVASDAIFEAEQTNEELGYEGDSVDLDGVSFRKDRRGGPAEKAIITSGFQSQPAEQLIRNTHRNIFTDGAQISTSQDVKQPAHRTLSPPSRVGRIQAIYEARSFKPESSPIRPRTISLQDYGVARSPYRPFDSKGSTTPSGTPGAFNLRAI